MELHKGKLCDRLWCYWIKNFIFRGSHYIFFPTDTGSLGYLNIYPLILWKVCASIFMAQELTCSNESYNVGSRVWKPLNPPLAQISQWQGHSGLSNKYCECKTIPSHRNFNYKCILNEYLIHSSRRNIIFTRKMKQLIEGSCGIWNRSCMQNQDGKQKPDIEFSSGIMNPSLEFDPRIHITYMSVGICRFARISLRSYTNKRIFLQEQAGG